LAKAHCSTANNNSNRFARLGTHQSVSMTVGIIRVFAGTNPQKHSVYRNE
jgi:hypothetical protein